MLASSLWTQWSLDPSISLLAIMLLLWWRGGRTGQLTPAWRRRGAAFWGGVLTLVVALNSPIDAESQRLFWVHMLQHVLLLTVAPCLLVLARPMPRALRGVPRAARLSIVHVIRDGRWGSPLRWLARPSVAWCTFCAALLGWHLPVLYDAALRHQAVHDLEHLTFVAAGLLFWNHALGIPPFAHSLRWAERVAYVAGAMIVGWILAVTLAVIPHPLYGFYVHEVARPRGLSALADQQLAAGVMWVPGSITFTIAIVMALYRGLTPLPKTPTRTTAA